MEQVMPGVTAIEGPFTLRASSTVVLVFVTVDTEFPVPFTVCVTVTWVVFFTTCCPFCVVLDVSSQIKLDIRLQSMRVSS